MKLISPYFEIMWSNYHTHSHYCDGKGSPEEYVAAAMAKGMQSLGFSSHAPIPFPCKWTMRNERFNDYLQTINTLKKQFPSIEIYTGLEIDYIPRAVSPDTFRDQLDYTIGSIHFVDAFSDGRPWEIDGTHSSFVEGFEQIFGGDIRAAIRRYYAITREMILTACPDIIGHLDKIKIQNTGITTFSEEAIWYIEEILHTIDVIDDAGAIVEVNTRGIYQKKSATTYPSPWILKLLKNKNIPVTISSDAHHPDDLANQFKETAAMLRTIGFDKIMILKAGNWEAIALPA